MSAAWCDSVEGVGHSEPSFVYGAGRRTRQVHLDLGEGEFGRAKSGEQGGKNLSRAPAASIARSAAAVL